MHTANDPDPAPSPDYLWQTLRAYIGHAFTALGAPVEIARTIWVTRDQARAMHDVLRPLEIMLRRLVFIMALTLTPPAPAPQRARTPQPRRDTFNLESAETWRPSFNLNMNPRHIRLRALKTTSAAPQRPNIAATAPIALRLEALVRGFNDPDKLARRMARLLDRDRARQWKILADIPATDRAKPFFAQAALSIQLAREKFESWLQAQLATPLTDSS